MKTQVQTPQMVFMQPQRLAVPLFQRPYVWNEENQWAPLWADVERVADRALDGIGQVPAPHFLGAVVLQTGPTTLGALQQWVVIDGQQRLTTLQLLLDAIQGEFAAVGAAAEASRLEALVSNTTAFRSAPEDQFKVWPTNRDRSAFQEVMSAAAPVRYDGLVHRRHRFALAHRFFAECARRWLTAESGSVGLRAAALDRSVRDLLQLVVIELAADENAQEIFETLNARGAQLTAADLIKNFVFQRLLEQKADVEQIYERHWQHFETAFWEEEVGYGRVRQPRSSLFLNQWLVARTGNETLAREVFTAFKRHADHETREPITSLVENIERCSSTYRHLIDVAQENSMVDFLSIYAYRSSVLESDVVRPLALHLLDPTLPVVPPAQLQMALLSLESWTMRRMLLRLGTANHNKLIAELIRVLRTSDREVAGDMTEQHLRSQKGTSTYWPDDDEIRRELTTLPAYRRLSRGRLRMVLEAIEDHRRGWRDGREGLGGQRVLRGKYTIEHVMPQQWTSHWPLPEGDPTERDQLIHTLGNLTLVTHSLNSGLSNAPWPTKKGALQQHDVLKLTSDILSIDDWGEAAIVARTNSMVTAVLEIWPTPPGHRSQRSGAAVEAGPVLSEFTVLDLVEAGCLVPGAPLYAREHKHRDRVATVLQDGRLDVDGHVFATPSGAATHIAGSNRNGWHFLLVRPGGLSLRELAEEYFAQVERADSPLLDES
jgi:hypothetical protein